MKRHKEIFASKWLLPLLLLQLMTVTFYAQIPHELSYQGVLADSAGVPFMDGEYELTFRLFEEPGGGTAIWEDQQAIIIRNGVFSTLLGASGLELPFDKTYWLEVAYEGETLGLRSKLTASPYSLNAANVMDSVISGRKIANDQVVRSLNGLKDDISLAAGANITLTTQGNMLVIAADDSLGNGGGNSPWTDIGTAIHYTDGNVGIGTDDPQAQLEITGNLRLPHTADAGAVGVIEVEDSSLIHIYGKDNFFAGILAGNFSLDTTENVGARLNVGVGRQSLSSLTNGVGNVGVGLTTLKNNTSGSFNTALGQTSLYSNTSGSLNTAVGRFALYANTTSSNNTAIGVSALLVTIGNGNTGVGVGSLLSNTTGTNNTAIGYQANTAGATLTNATAIGYDAVVDASNKIRLGNDSVTVVETAGTVVAAAFEGDGSLLTNLPDAAWQQGTGGIHYSDGNVGVGTAVPIARIHSEGDDSFPGFHSAGGSADFSVPLDETMQFGHWDGTSFTERIRLDSDGNLGIGNVNANAMVHVRNQGGLPSFHSSGTSRDFSVPNNQAMQFGHWDGNAVLTERMRIADDGNVGIGTTAPLSLLDVAGTITATDLDLTKTTNATAFDLQHSGLLTTTLAQIETASNPSLTARMLKISAGASMATLARFIQCERGTDVRFRVDGSGDAFADGAFNGGGADFAEMMAVSSGATSVEAGDVMVIDPLGERAIRKSSEARSTLVAGIYSTQPGFLGSERAWDEPSGDDIKTWTRKDLAERFDEIPMAVVGIVPCKVSAENGAIQPGDLLVTATIPGHAMREDDPKNGTILGKALGSLGAGTGVIKVLVTLQ